ncbi:hypothetical protein, partial [Vulcanococcus limneticus]|uniref:hypothetical protein n=1 Tax=Vulcanococcus limneticus TaxID=2170428 RepID=UPI00398C1097
LLFVREQRKQGTVTEPFVCLGFARYESHEGERPMAIRWRLEREIPAAWLHGCCVAHQLFLAIPGVGGLRPARLPQKGLATP